MKTLKIVSKNLFDQKLQYSAPQKLSAAEIETARGLYQQWLGKSPSQKSDFIFVPKWEDCLNLAIDFRQRYSTLIVLGTGGSSLGAKSLISALKKSPSRDGSASKTVHFVENLDPSHIHKIIETCDLKQTAVALVSKSGKTLESTSAYLRIQAEFEKAGCKIYDHSIFIASKDNNPLFALSQRNNVPFLEIPQLTGGRFCIFTSAGLFPAAFAGIDLSKFCTRAQEVLSLENSNDHLWSFAQRIFELEEAGIDVHVCMPYNNSLKEFSYWFRQLWGESLSKKKNHYLSVGATPLAALGAIDQHSLLQSFSEGPNRYLCGFIKVLNWENDDFKFSTKESDFSSLGSINGMRLGEILNLQLEATKKSLQEKGRPTYTVEIDRLNEESMAELYASYMMLCSMVGALHKIDPFDQPGVERGKEIFQDFL